MYRDPHERQRPSRAPSADRRPRGDAVTSDSDVAPVLDRLREVIDELTGLSLVERGTDQLCQVARDVTVQVGRLEGVRARAVLAAESTGEIERSGATSGTAWLADVTGGTPAVAARTASLGRALERLPSLAAAVADGTVGTEHAASIARAADRGVLDDDQLGAAVVEATQLPAGAFTRFVRGTEARTDQRQRRRDERRARERRSARWWREDDGSVRGDFHLDAIAGETFVTAIDALAQPDPADTPDGLRRSPTQRRADALTALARLALDRGETPLVRTVRPHVTVTVPVSMLAESDADAEADGALGTLPDGTIVSAETARRLLCDASVRRVVLDPDGQPLDVGRATRNWNAAQRSALNATDGGCRGPACDRPSAWTDIHHITWWRNQGTTAIANGLELCGHCHDLVHHSGWTVVLDPRTRHATWTSPVGAVVTTFPRGPAARRATAEQPTLGDLPGDLPRAVHRR